jgi:hypothetical protein
MTSRHKGVRFRVIVWCGVTTLLLAILASLPVFVFPSVDDPKDVDAVFVIGPPTFDRIRMARELIDEGRTDTLVVSVADPDSDESYVQKICDVDQADRVICLRPDPYTTQGEARALRDLAEANGWSSAAVITATPHVTRSRLIFERCFPGELSLLASRGPRDFLGWVDQYVYQSGAFIKAWIHQEC